MDEETLFASDAFAQLKDALVAYALPKNIAALKRDLGKYRIDYDAVSYTHLDVYKRQSLCSTIRSLPSLISGTISVGTLMSQILSLIHISITQGCPDGRQKAFLPFRTVVLHKIRQQKGQLTSKR